MDGCKELPLLLVVFVGLTLFLACSGCTSSTPDISGTWHDSKNAESYYFLQSGNSVKGTVSTLLGSAEFTGKLAEQLNFNKYINIKVNSVDFGCVNKNDICSEYNAIKILSPVFKEISTSQNGIMLNIKSDTIYA